MSSLAITRLIGVPSVCPSYTPDRIFTVSDSLRWLTSALWPGARRSRSGWMSASDSGSRDGQPSTTAPTAPPWDSPHVVTRNRCPHVLPMTVRYRNAARRRAPCAGRAGLPPLPRRDDRRADGHVDADGHPVVAGARPHRLAVPPGTHRHASIRADPAALHLHRRAGRS